MVKNDPAEILAAVEALGCENILISCDSILMFQKNMLSDLQL